MAGISYIQIDPAWFLEVAVPAYDVVTQDLVYLPIPMNIWTSTIYAGSGNETSVIWWLQNSNARNPFWQTISDPTQETPFNIDATYKQLAFSNLNEVALNISTIGSGVDRAWLPSKYGRYGFLQGYNANGRGPLQQITHPQQVFSYPPGRWDGVYIQLAPLCSGVATLSPWIGIPPLYFNWSDQGWQTYTGGFPWFGATPPAPGSMSRLSLKHHR